MRQRVGSRFSLEAYFHQYTILLIDTVTYCWDCLFGLLNPGTTVLTRFCVAPARLRYYNCIIAEAVYDANKAIKLDASIPKAYMRKW